MSETILALAVFAVIGVATPFATLSGAAAQTNLIVKGGSHDHGMHRGSHHGRKVTIVKKRGHCRHDRGHLRQDYN